MRPPQGWLNDPNGLCLVDGRYHVFYQYNSQAPRHGDIDWGHASSADLLSWVYEPVGLRHRPGQVDGGGCWSGCVVEDAGVPTAVYTAITEGCYGAERAQVLLARSDRSLRTWVQDEIPVMGPPDTVDLAQVRDPFVFTFGGHRYAVQGAGRPGGPPQLLLYGCDDLTRWTELGSLLTSEDPVAAATAPADIWECPNLAEVDGRWVLIVSLWRWVGGTHLLAGVRYLLGDLESRGSGLRFVPTSGGLVDGGPTFYAPQVLAVADRVLLWGWAWEQGRSEEQLDRAGWAGVLTWPRELSVADGALVSRPARELLGLRGAQLDWRPRVAFTTKAFELESTGALRLYLRDSVQDLLVAQTTGPARILVDGSMVEIFSGPAPATTRAYPGTTGGWVVEAEPGDVTGYLLGTGQ